MDAGCRSLEDTPGNRGCAGDKTSTGQGSTLIYDGILRSRREQQGLQLMEVGIFNGASLAMWCDSFSDSSVHGVDINIRLWKKHESAADFRRASAFSRNTVIVHEFDTYGDAFRDFVSGSGTAWA